MDRGDWQTTVHGVAKNQTQWKRLSTHACTIYVNLPEDRLLPTLDKQHVQNTLTVFCLSILGILMVFSLSLYILKVFQWLYVSPIFNGKTQDDQELHWM